MERGFWVHRWTVLGSGDADAMPARGGRGPHDLRPPLLQVSVVAVMGAIMFLCSSSRDIVHGVLILHEDTGGGCT